MSPRLSTSLIVLLLVLGVPGVAHASDPVVIVSPMEGDVVVSPLIVEVTFGLVTVCHEDGDSGESCVDEPPMRVELYAELPNDELHLWLCEPCEGTETIFEIELPPGANLLRAAARSSPAAEWSEFVNIVVEEEASSGDASTGSGSTTEAGSTADITSGGAVTSGAGTAGSSGAESATSGENTPHKDACACAEAEQNGLAWLGLACLATRRRRAARTSAT